jgi:hypothetical protein
MRRAGVRFMVIGGIFRDVAIRAASTGDIDVVLVDQFARGTIGEKIADLQERKASGTRR